MKLKTILTTSLVAVFAIMMAITPAYAASYLDMTKAEVEKRSFEIKTGATIPQDGSAGLFGYAVFGENGLIAVTTHGGVWDSDAQSGPSDPVFHTHIVQLNAKSADCSSGIQVASASEATVGKLEVDKNYIEVSKIPKDAVGKLSNTVVSFTLSGGDNGAICVNVSQLIQASSD